MDVELENSVTIGNHRIRNRFFRAPLLECAGNGPDAVGTFIDELEPCAEAGIGLIFQGASIVRDGSGCAAPNMTRVHDPEFVSRLSRLTETVHKYGASIFIQLGHGGLRSRETWHHAYRDRDLTQLAVSELPLPLKLADRTGLLDYNIRVLSTDEVYELAEDFAKSARYSIEAGYDGIHLSAANMSIIQQFLSPFYNDREDEFGGDHLDRARFLEVVHDKIRETVGASVPLVTKVPAETQAPWFVRKRITMDEAIEVAEYLEDVGYDALVPVQTSVFWDMNLIKGWFPKRSWTEERFQDGYRESFGGTWAKKLVEYANWLQSWEARYDPVWNHDFFSTVKARVNVPILAVGGIRTREQIDALLDDRDCDMVGMGRPFYAEPKLPARLLAPAESAPEALCNSCNNCTVPQVVGERGICRTPSVMKQKAEKEADGLYEDQI
jgi:2,4-dienoyl-CoA reductase-like NADH-dependent reductase (Old Yellow Enzyme family)